MEKRLFVTIIIVFLACVLSARSVVTQEVNTNFVSPPSYSAVLIAACETLLPKPCRGKLWFLGQAFFFHPQADGGGDGGGDRGGDGGSGTGDGGDGSGGDGSDSGDTGSGASDSSGSAPDSTGPSDNGDPDSDPPAAADPTDPTDVNNAVDFAAQQSFDAVANPFGGVSSTVPLQNSTANGAGAEPVPGSPGGPRSPGSPGREPDAVPPPPTVNAPAQARAQIHAVIVSGLADPSQVLWGNVNLTGGIVALGSPDSATPQPAGRWDPNVRITPDPELLNGNKIPPLVPNVFDVRIMHHEVSATVVSEGSISGRSEPASNNTGRDGP